MNIKAIAQAMRERMMPWDTARRVFDAGEIDKAHGWDNTLRKLDEVDVEPEEDVEHLGRYLKGHILGGEKLTRFYKLPKAQIAELRNAVLDLTPPNTAMKRAYPLNLSADEIEESFPRPHRLVAVERTEDGVGVVFGSTRAIQTRETIDPEDFPDSASSILEQFDEIVGVKLKKFQAMDVVWIPHDGRYVDVRVDSPRGMHLDVGGGAHAATNRALTQLIGNDHLAQPVNLFPLIRKIYDEPDEGNVVELAFGTTTASLKHEKMRRGRNCLRSERYHIGGKQALRSQIEPFKLSVKWEIEDGILSSPELSLSGTSRMTGSTNPKIIDATIRGCAGVAEYEFVRERIDHYLRT